MSTDVASIVPPNDTGSDTFARFCYQAHVAFPYCLNCALGGDVDAVVAEHIEDLAIDRGSNWQFIQIKTRNQDLGPWKLSDISGSSGALGSALRSHRAAGNAPVTIHIFLEGPGKSGDDISALSNRTASPPASVLEKIQRSLVIDATECSELISRLTVEPGLPSRDGIVDRNLRHLMNQAPKLTAETLQAIYDSVISRLYAAMALDRLEPSWFSIILDPNKAISSDRQKYEAKRVPREELRSLLGSITSPKKFLLNRFAESDTQAMSALEQKLIAGGATDLIISDAKQLRANASSAEYSYLSTSSVDGQDAIEDVRLRLQVQVNSLLGLIESEKHPARKVWNDLLPRLSLMKDDIDQGNIFSKDPYLLLGELCEMSDLCLTHWGISDEG